MYNYVIWIYVHVYEDVYGKESDRWVVRRMKGWMTKNNWMEHSQIDHGLFGEAKQFDDVFEARNPHWTRVRTTPHDLSLWEEAYTQEDVYRLDDKWIEKKEILTID